MDAFVAKVGDLNEARAVLAAAERLATASAFGRGRVGITAGGTWQERSRRKHGGELIFAGESPVDAGSLRAARRFVRLCVGSEWLDAEPWNGGVSGGDAYIMITVANDW